MRCVKCLKILIHATVRSQIWESTDRNAIILLIILFTFLSPPTHISLCLQHSYLSLSSLVSISSLLPISFSLSFFLSLTLFLSLCISVLSPQIQPVSAPLSLSLSLSLSIFLSLSLSLSFPIMKKKAILIWSRARRLKLVDWTSTRRSEALLAQGQSPILARRPPSSRRRWLVEFGHWLICWVGVLLKILSFYFILFFILLRFFDLEFVGGFDDCDCSLLRWLLLWQWL